jgi:hypothetical protein
MTGPAAALWRHLFGDRQDRIALCSGKRTRGVEKLEKFTTAYFDYPAQVDKAEAWARHQVGRETYFAAHLLFDDRRVKEHASPVLALWADNDGGTIPDGFPKPTARLQSSPGHTHDFWRLKHPVSPARAELLNKRIALAVGADPSGVDITQLLRVPGTPNWKYSTSPIVEVLEIHVELAYDPDELDRLLPKLPEQERKSGAVAESDIDKADDELLQAMLRSKHGQKIRALLDNDAERLVTYPECLTDKRLDANKCDLSLANFLAFYYGTQERADTAFRRSKRVRDKWDEKHRADGATYGEMTLEKAFNDRTAFYTPASDGPDLAEGIAEQQAAVEEAERIAAGGPNAAGCCGGCACDCCTKRRPQLERAYQATRQHVVAMTTIRTSTGLSGKHKSVADALLLKVEDARRRGQSEVKIYYGDRTARKEGRDPGGLARDAGTSPSTVGTLVEELRGHDASPYTFQTIEGENGLPRVVVKFDPTSTMAADAAAIAALTREKAQHGGFRLACPDHPNAPLVQTTACAECGQIVDQKHLNVDRESTGSKLLQGIARASRLRGEQVSRVATSAASPERSEAPAVEPEPLQHDATRPPAPQAEAPPDPLADVGFDPVEVEQTRQRSQPPMILRETLSIGGSLGWSPLKVNGMVLHGRQGWERLAEPSMLAHLPDAYRAAEYLAAQRSRTNGGGA